MNKSIAVLCAAVAPVLASYRAFAGVDGTINAADGYTTTVLQNNPTGFGDNQSELDGASLKYAPGGKLELGLTGNLETGNTLVLFIDSKTGGAVNAAVPGGFNNFGLANDGFRTGGWVGATLAPGFNPDYSIELNRDSTGYFMDVIDLHEPQGSINQKIFVSHFTTAGGPYSVANGNSATTYRRDNNTTSAGVIEHHLDDSNTAGVTGTDATGAASATTGWEFTFDPTFLGYTPGTAMRAMAMIHGGDSYLSNQFLPGLGGTAANLGYNKFNAQIYGDQSYLEAFVPTNTANGTTLWNTPADWTGGTTPNGAEHAAVFAGTSVQTVDVGFGVSVGYLKFANASGVTINGGASLSIDGGAGSGIMLSTAGTHSIFAPVSFPDDTRIDTADTTSISIRSGYTLPANKRISKAGAGNLRLAGALDNGTGSSLAVDGGIAVIDSDMGAGSGKPDVYVGGVGSIASVIFNAAQSLNAIAINNQGTATLNDDVVLKNLYVNGGTAVGSGTITIDDGGAGGAQIKSDGGTGDGHVNVPVNIPVSINADIAGGATAFLDGPMTLGAGKTITKVNDGWLQIDGPQSNGAGSAIAIDYGQVNFGSNIGAGLTGADRPNVYVNVGTGGNGKARIDANQQLNTLHVNNDGVATITPTANGSRLVEAQSLSMDATGKLDIGNNKVMVHGGTLGSWNGSAYDGLTGEIQRGRNGGAWDGAGGVITTLTAAATPNTLTTVAIALADDIGKVGKSFGGTVAASGDVLMMYTYNGDVNLNGRVDADDYFVIDSNYNKSGSVFGYEKGDFSYDGKINGDDYMLIDAAYAGQGTPFSSASGEVAGVSGVSAVPEPAGVGLMLIGAAATLRRRRSR